jgi:hypothetical protein
MASFKWHLAMAFAEAAHYAAIWNPVIQRFSQRRQNRVHKDGGQDNHAQQVGEGVVE